MTQEISSDEDERSLASAVQFLIDGGEEDAASVLLSCTLEINCANDTWMDGNETIYAQHVRLTGPRAAYEILSDHNHVLYAAIRRAFEAVNFPGTYIKNFTAHASIIDPDPTWRMELLEIARGRGVSNQRAEGSQIRALTWKNLHFRSQSEIRIAKALDKAKVFFLPNCKGRLNTPEGRGNKEPDFLVCCDGKWGVLEVDGEPFHPPSRTVQDHERDRMFKSHGIRVVEHFDANECFNDADGVVERFLEILKGP